MLPQVTFRGLSPSVDIVDTVIKKANKLSEIAPQLRGCHVVIEAAVRGNHRPLSYRVSLQLSGGTEALRRPPRHVTHESLYVAIGDVFKLAHRQLTARSIRPTHQHL
jgi:ribosome-associated translation inhibitor RaiA